MKTTRQRLVEYLKAHRAATAAELSRALQVTIADARHHLKILSAEGAVQIVGELSGRGRGRPAHLYGPVKGEQGYGLQKLTDALLDEMLAETTPDHQSVFLQRIASRLTGDSQSGGTLTQRLLLAVRRLNELGYQARWEAHAGAPKITFENCPFSVLLDNHPEVCSMDGFLLEKLLGAPVRQTTRLEREARGGKVCRFEVG